MREDLGPGFGGERDESHFVPVGEGDYFLWSVSIGRGVWWGGGICIFVYVGSEKERGNVELTGHVFAVGVPRVSKMLFRRASSLPSAPALNNVHSPLVLLFVVVRACTISATTQPAAQRSMAVV